MCILFSCNLIVIEQVIFTLPINPGNLKCVQFLEIFLKFVLFNGPKMTKKKLIPPALPTLNMPQKMHTKETVSTPHRSIVEENLPDVRENHSYYNDLSDVIKRNVNLKSLTNWDTKVSPSEVAISKSSQYLKTLLPELTILIDDGLGFTIKVYNCLLPEDHNIYQDN